MSTVPGAGALTSVEQLTLDKMRLEARLKEAEARIERISAILHGMEFGGWIEIRVDDLDDLFYDGYLPREGVKDA